jgi:predicted lipoprotein with Yx(FWY)xxD motif
VATTALLAAACGGGTSSTDKTATAAAKGGTTPAAASPTKAAATVASTPVTTPQATAAAATAQATQPAASAGGAATVNVSDTALGNVLTDDKGMTLYVFKNDTTGSGKSACNGQCATAWPPLMGAAAPAMPAGATGDFTVITRDDGTKQIAYKGMPLYRYANDKSPGDTIGEGVGNLWTVAKP